jgi:hypothetical protein
MATSSSTPVQRAVLNSGYQSKFLQPPKPVLTSTTMDSLDWVAFNRRHRPEIIKYIVEAVPVVNRRAAITQARKDLEDFNGQVRDVFSRKQSVQEVYRILASNALDAEIREKLRNFLLKTIRVSLLQAKEGKKIEAEWTDLQANEFQNHCALLLEDLKNLENRQKPKSTEKYYVLNRPSLNPREYLQRSWDYILRKSQADPEYTNEQKALIKKHLDASIGDFDLMHIGFVNSSFSNVFIAMTDRKHPGNNLYSKMFEMLKARLQFRARHLISSR